MKNSTKLLGTLLMSLFCALASAQHPDGYTGSLIVVNKRGNDASFIDLASGEIVASLPTGRGPHELIVTANGRWAIVTDYSGGNSLTVFDIENLAVHRTIDLRAYPRPHGIALLPGQEEVIVTSEARQTLLIVNFKSGEILGTIDTGQSGSHMVALSADGRVAYTSNGRSDSVSVIDVGAGQFEKSISVPDRPEAISTNNSGSEIWVGSNDAGVVTVFSAADGSEIAQWAGFSWPYRILLTGDGRYAVIPDLGKQQLRFFDARSKTELGSINLPGSSPQGVTLYGDDRTLFLSLSAQNKVLVIDIESRKILGEYNTGESPDGIAYTPLVLRKNINVQKRQ